MQGVLKPGDVVSYYDEFGNPHFALVTAYHDGGNNKPGMAINCVFVSADKAKTDPYGMQLERASSVSAKSEHTAHGRYYETI